MISPILFKYVFSPETGIKNIEIKRIKKINIEIKNLKNLNIISPHKIKYSYLKI